MVSETSLVASNVRLHEWALQIRNCKERPSGMSVPEWCEIHGITKASYYYRLRRVREAMLAKIDADTLPEFVELSSRMSQDTLANDTSAIPVAATIQVGTDTVIQISDQASEDFLRKFLQAAKSC